MVGLELDLEEGREGIVGGCPAELSGIGDTDRGVGGQRIVEAGFGDEGIAVARRALDGERTAALEGERGGRGGIAIGMAPAEHGAGGERQGAGERGFGAQAERGGGDVLAGRQRGERGEAAVFAEAVLMEVDDGPAGERLEPGVAERQAAERRGGEVEAIAGLAERLCGGAVAVGSGRLAEAREDDPAVEPGGVAAVGSPGGELDGTIGGTAVKRGKDAVDTARRGALVDVEIVVE